MIAAAWLAGKLMGRLGPFLLIGAAALVLGMVGAIGALAWTNAGLRDDVTASNAALAQCTADLTVSQQNVGALDATLTAHNETVEAAVLDCRERDQAPVAAVERILSAPMRRWPEGAQGMNEWLASK